MGEFIEALRHHEADLSLSRAASDPSGEARALLHVAAAREALGQVDEAVEAYKNSMDAVATMHNDAEATATRIQALASLGKLNYT
jgi:tetratricopeptide (TPR) repeat protein